jgi:hypothetical protein
MKMGSLILPDYLTEHTLHAGFEQWGLRGDKPLYEWLKKEIDPNLNIDTKEEFVAYIVNLIKEKLNVDIMTAIKTDGTRPGENKTLVKVPQFYEGPGHGMSSGLVSLIYWQQRGIPALVKLFDEQRKICCAHAELAVLDQSL